MPGEAQLTASSGGGSAAFVGPPTSSANTKLKLPADTGAAGKVLSVKSANHSSTNCELEWGSNSGGILQVKHLRKGDKLSTAAVVTDNAFTSGTEFMSIAITPSAASSYIWVTGMLHLFHKSDYAGHYWLTYNHSSISEKMIAGNANTSRRRTGKFEHGSNLGSNIGPASSINIMFAPNTTEEITVKIRAATTNSGFPSYLNRNPDDSTNAEDGGNPMSTLTLAEVAGGISPNITDDSSIYEGT